MKIKIKIINSASNPTMSRGQPWIKKIHHWKNKMIKLTEAKVKYQLNSGIDGVQESGGRGYVLGNGAGGCPRYQFKYFLCCKKISGYPFFPIFFAHNCFTVTICSTLDIDSWFLAIVQPIVQDFSWGEGPEYAERTRCKWRFGVRVE